VIPAFDIFVLESDGSLRWRAAADTLETAQDRVRALAESEPATQQRYVIFNQQTGQRLVVDGSALLPVYRPPADAKHPWYHICRVDKDKLRWVEAAETLQVAETRIKVLKAFYPGDYLVLDYNPEHRDSPPPWTTMSVVLSSLSL
jgi:hypothetical protein